MGDYRLWALGSAVFAALTAILSKKGLEGVPSNLAMVVRVGFVLIVTLCLALATKEFRPQELTPKHYLVLGGSAVATGLSWICYFRALQLGEVSKVAPIDKLSFVMAMILGVIVLKEKPSLYTWAGAALVVCGVLLTLKG
ncbi:MAG: EamA family transporter [bacterium]